MSENQRAQIVLELDGGGDAIRGHLIDGEGDRHVFHGWMRLMTLMESVRNLENEGEIDDARHSS